MQYDEDFYAWTQEQAENLRAGRLTHLDTLNIAEELESLGNRERRELKSRLVVLLTHLLKWQYQPSRRSRSWEVTIGNQRLELADHLSENPSLHPQLDALVEKAYPLAVGAAYAQTTLAREIFPATCPFTQEQLFDPDFWPGDSDAQPL